MPRFQVRYSSPVIEHGYEIRNCYVNAPCIASATAKFHEGDYEDDEYYDYESNGYGWEPDPHNSTREVCHVEPDY